MPRHYTGGEVSVLESFALHAGVAMRNAGNFAQLRQRRLDRAGILSAITASRADGLAALVHQDQEERCFGLTLHSSSGRGDSLLVCLRGPVDDIRMRNLERSAVALSIAKLWTERQIASSTSLRHLALVAQPEAPTIAAARDRLKLGPGQPVQLALIALPGTDRAAQIDTIRCVGSHLDILVDAIDDHCLAVGATSAVEGFVATLGRAQPGWAPGGQLSDPFTGLEETGNRYKHVAKAMQVMAKLSRLDRFLSKREISLFARIFGSADLTGIGAFVTDRLAPLDKRDPHRRAQLKATLLACFDNQYSIARTAAEMGIHVNTARQRLNSAADVTGGWRDPTVAMELHVALRLDALHLL